ncbi:MAG: tRNA uridine-5-carboxymethylaminomethyl(34) synthesis GTPase MnmE [Bacteroidales bacterium]|nr:tRNA uridine-5-carboxymethylaminomethyl(34) synthesis GTPase MnmE [Bacteroidales bacterium]
MVRLSETICAPATATGGALALVRISGPESLGICSRIFSPSDKEARIEDQQGNTIIHGIVKSGEEVVDEVLVSIFRAPHSYTGEDSAEISCHASPYIIKRILELLIHNGASAADPGEFTRRAFMNGRIDLLQAEAVADIISSSSKAAHMLAMNQMRGGFSSEIAGLRKELLDFASLIELELDFGEEDVQFADREKLVEIVQRVKSISDRLAESFSTGNAIRNGIPVAIVGKPNSGKSTLLNALLSEDRAIVSEIPGTTRDTIEDTLVIDGMEFRFIDTAGIHDTTDIVEIMGIKKTREKIRQSKVVLLVDEIGDAPASINKRIRSMQDILKDSDKHLLVVINKADLATAEQAGKVAASLVPGIENDILVISAKGGTGLEDLKRRISETAFNKKFSSGDVILTNIRHYEAMLIVSESMKRVLYGLKNQVPEDFLAIDIRQAIHYLGEITGEITSDEILGNIFKNFCIGK